MLYFPWSDGTRNIALPFEKSILLGTRPRTASRPGGSRSVSKEGLRELCRFCLRVLRVCTPVLRGLPCPHREEGTEAGVCSWTSRVDYGHPDPRKIWGLANSVSGMAEDPQEDARLPPPQNKLQQKLRLSLTAMLLESLLCGTAMD